jgi:nuclear-control-of-ATPase protein 2
MNLSVDCGMVPLNRPNCTPPNTDCADYRNVARILTSSAISSNGTIPYKDSGQLICEAEALLQQMRAVFSSMKYQEFREDIQDLLNVQIGVDKQLRVIERMRWSYFQ